ncbi:MAG: T9SS type A sorting domain-containing protein [Bacteroidota bacterium]
MKKRILRNLTIINCLSALALALTVGSAQAQTPGLKINQVYGGAGMDALGYKYDYVELINTSNVTVAYANIYIFVGKYNNLSPTTVSLGPVSVPARSYYLIRFAGSPSNLGSDLITQDADAGNVVLPGGNSGDAAVGVVMLYSVNPNSPTSCNVTTGLLDKLSYGGFIWTNCYEGTQSALYTDGTHALQRKVVNGNAQDTDNNSNDFILVAPTPRNSGSVPLPVQMVNVAAVYTSDRDVKISWSTISEIDNYGFTVERRSGNDATFVTLPGSFQSGHGTTLQTYQYTFTDASALEGVAYQYRIKQTDLNGQAHYSEVVNVTDGTTGVKGQKDVPKEFALKQNFPNPFNPSTMIEFTVAQSGTTRLLVFNPLGQEVARLFDETADAGQRYVVRFDAGQLSTGTYFARLESANQVKIMKMALVK